MTRSLLLLPLAACLLTACDDPVTQDQIDKLAALSTQRTQAATKHQEHLITAAAPALALDGPLAPRPDLGPCDHNATATLELAPWPKALIATTGPDADTELNALAARAASPDYTSTHLLVPAYEIVIAPEMDPGLKGFKPGVGRGRVAVIDVATSEVVCLGTSGVRATTTDLQIKRRAVAGGLMADLTAEQRHQAAIDESQVLVVRAFERQLLDAAKDALVKAGPPLEDAVRDKIIDPDEARKALGK